METFEIEYDNPTRVYAPGERVTGKVIIRNSHSLNALSLKVCIHGEAHNFWRKFENKGKFDKNGRWYTFSEHINYDSRIMYLNGVAKPWSSLDGTNKIPCGVNIFPFVFQLPLNCPPSFEGSHGSIRYSVHVELDRPWRFNADTKKVFSVIPCTDLNTIPKAVNPMIAHACKHSGFLGNREVKMKVNIPKRGFIAGELIPIHIQITNHSKKPINEAKAQLIQHVHYSAQRAHSHLFPQEHCEKHCEHKTARTVMAEIEKSVRVECCTDVRVDLVLVVPQPLTPSFHIPILDVDYVVSVEMGEKLKCEFPLIIGSVPVSQMVSIVPPPAFVGSSRDPEKSHLGQLLTLPYSLFR
ncbi:unnamed protein product [Caenorhabditis sp. 36 PRJEB53466]|nr:unnamed protein product [Caenorhabditis sp. 36 PRJEB53466]